MQSQISLGSGLALILAATGMAQAPDVIHYTFDSGNANNSAVPGVGNGTPNTSVIFGPTLCNDTAIVAAVAPQIASGWQLDLGMSSWTIAMWLDLRVGGNAFQYFYGASGTGGFRCFGAGAAGVNGVMLRTLGGADVILPGGTVNTGPVHCCWSFDNTTNVVSGYVDGVNVATVLLTSPANLNSTAADFNVMRYTAGSPMLTGNLLDDFRVYRRALSAGEVAALVAGCGQGGGIGSSYCGPAVPNTSGGSAVLTASGSEVAANNNVTLQASSLPANQFGFFLTSMTQGLVMNPGGSNGNLCLGGTIGRYVGSGQIMNAGAGGTISLTLDLTQTPAGGVFVSIAAGETWNFQAWFRDIGPMGQPESNFTDGRSITFQ